MRLSPNIWGIGEKNPKSFKENKHNDQIKIWTYIILEELKSIKDKDFWDLEELPKEKRHFGCKWIFKTKMNLKENIERYKAQLITKDFTQKEDIRL